MKYGKIKINARLKPRPLFEIRFVTKQYSRVLLGLATDRYGVCFVIWPFVLSLTVMRKIKPSKLTEEEIAELKKNDTDLQD